MNELRDFFQKQFGTAPTHFVQAPGRVELLGNHTDYNQGLVMALAVDKFITLAVAPRPDGIVEIHDMAFPEVARFPVDKIAKDPAISWANYPKGLLLQLQKRGVPFGGFNAAIRSTVPLGAGLSSSAAFLVATALAVRKLYPYSLTEAGAGAPPPPDAAGNLPPLDNVEKMLFARACQAAENQFVGVNCGLLDHISSLFGRAWQVILIDCLHLTVNWSPLHGDIAVVVCHSGVKHALVGGEYNDRRAHCEAAAKSLGVPSLRFATLELLQANQAELAPRDYGCALHVVGENQRVSEGSQLLRADKLAEFGPLLFASHESSRLNFLNSCPELDVLVELAKTHPGCLGARLTGGGFGGATLNLVRRHQAEDFRATMAAGYEQRTGHKLQSWICQVVDGAA
jgi:galactokinase